MKPRIVLLATGGTIASRYDQKLGSTVASQRADELLRMLPQVTDFAEIEVHDIATIPSYEMDLQFAFDLARRIKDVLGRPEVAGVVVTHGTDTMEETCYLADLLLDSDKPVVYTGAQRAHDDPQSDGPLNLLNALRVAASPSARGLGAMICFNGTIHAARDVTKVHASAVETFQSYEHGALGEVDGAKVVIHRRPVLRQSFKVDRLEERVELFRLALGTDLRGLEAAIERGVAGLVIEGFGRGNGPSRLAELVRLATRKDVPVLITSRCPVGRVQPVYGGGGGGRDLADAGGIFAGDLKGPKARLLLMVLLSSAKTRTWIAETVAALAP
ncbi:MAG TPA: asparaginase [Burkholderiales bacterium]|jgi:L-asparaginase|nr:asparaginase [Burkholderiales bacterium]